MALSLNTTPSRLNVSPPRPHNRPSTQLSAAPHSRCAHTPRQPASVRLGSVPLGSGLSWSWRAPKCNARRQTTLIVSAGDVEALPEPLKKIVMNFQMVPDPMARYKQLLFYAAKLKALPKEFQTPENKVPGCVSQVWVVPTIEDGLVQFKAESDSQLTKGLAALLVEGLSGCTPQEVLSVKPDFIEMLGLSQSLTPSRNNGFLNMLLTMQKKTIQAFMESEKEGKAAPPEEVAEPVQEGPKPGEGGVKISMTKKLGEAFYPTTLVVNDDSSQHAGHGGSKGLRTGETHFSVEIVSEAFEGMNRVKRQRAVYEVLDEEIKGGVHALSLVTKTPAEISG